MATWVNHMESLYANIFLTDLTGLPCTSPHCTDRIDSTDWLCKDYINRNEYMIIGRSRAKGLWSSAYLKMKYKPIP